VTITAMISSSANLHAEREVLEYELSRAFEQVVVKPERSVAGTDARAYEADARNASLLVVLLGRESRPAVVREIKEALARGNHVAAFSLRYPPYSNGETWVPTPEEQLVREKNIWISSVAGIQELRKKMWQAVAYFIDVSVRTHRLDSSAMAYNLWKEWLEGARERIYLVQRTSSIVLGPRRGNLEEAACLDLIEAAIRRPKASRPEIIHLYDDLATRQAAQEVHAPYELEAARRRVVQFCKVTPRGNAPLVRLVPINTSRSPLSPSLLVDNRVALSSLLGATQVMSVIDSSEQRANLISDAIRANCVGAYDRAFVAESLAGIYDDPGFEFR
jgi:hypothetical protein